MTFGLVLVGLGALVWWGPSPARRLRRLAPVRAATAGRGWPAWALLVVSTVSVGLLAGHPGLVLAVAIGVGVVGWLLARTSADRRRHAVRKQVSTSATSLALLMRSGMIPTTALKEAATGSPCLEAAAAASRLGTDVSSALERSSTVPGQDGLRTIAAAWRVSGRTGAPIASVVGRVAETLREQEKIQGVLEAEMSAARISGRIMACLPLFGLALGTIMGADPLGFLFSHWTGEWLVLGGVVLSTVGIAWTERIAGRVGT